MLMKGTAFSDIVFLLISELSRSWKELRLWKYVQVYADEGSYDSSVMLMNNLFLLNWQTKI